MERRKSSSVLVSHHSRHNQSIVHKVRPIYVLILFLID